MHSSCLFWNMSYPSGASVEPHAVRDDEARVDLSVLDPLEQRAQVALDVRLPGLDRQRLVHDRADGNLVDEPAVDAGDRDRAAVAAGHDRLAQGDRPVRLQHHRLLHAVVGVR